MTDEAVLLFDEPVEGVRRITFNRPDKLNAFNAALIDGLLDELERIKFDPSVRVVVLTGAGRGFCAGADLGGMGTLKRAPHDVGKVQQGRYFLAELSRIPVMLQSLPQPVICAVNGAAAGVGYSIALAADIIIAGRSARFVNAIHNAATGTELGMSYLLPRAVGTQRAAELLLTARPVLAEEAERIGLVLRAVADDRLMEEAYDLARAMMVNVPMGLWLTKQAFWSNQNAGSLEQAIEFEHRGVFIAQQTEDAAEKRRSYGEKRTPVFKHR